MRSRAARGEEEMKWACSSKDDMKGETVRIVPPASGAGAP